MTPQTLIDAIWVVWWLSWLLAAAWSDRATRRPALHQVLVYRLLTVIGGVVMFWPYSRHQQTGVVLWHTPVALAWLCGGAVLAGLMFTWWARLHLGRLWSSAVTRKADHRVVDTGPYGIVRHPIYTGITLAAAATAAARGLGLVWIGAAILTAGWVFKARLEESFLRAQLGSDAYDAYASRVPMLIPFARPRAAKT